MNQTFEFRGIMFRVACGPENKHSLAFFERGVPQNPPQPNTPKVLQEKIQWDLGKQIQLTGWGVGLKEELLTSCRTLAHDEIYRLRDLQVEALFVEVETNMNLLGESGKFPFKKGFEATQTVEILKDVTLHIACNSDKRRSCQIEFEGIRCHLDSPQQLEEWRLAIVGSL